MRDAVSEISAPSRATTGGQELAPESDTLVLRPVDVFAISVPLIFGLAILSNWARVPEWAPVSMALIGVALFGLLARIATQKTTHPLVQIVGNFYIILTIWTVYSRLDPLVDLVSPVSYDRDLQALDQWIFGVQPSVWLERFYTPWLTEILFIAYLAFFLWQIWLAIILYRRKNGEYEQYTLMIILFYMLSYSSYILVPAIGPRFDLAHLYGEPLQGVFFAGPIESLFATATPTLRDCFPSGHTGLTLLVLGQAYHKKAYKFFLLMFPFALLLIFATVYCRFHYVIDLMCAVPFIVGVLLVQSFVEKMMPREIIIPIRVRQKQTVGA